jgi:hypothetical protein
MYRQTGMGEIAKLVQETEKILYETIRDLVIVDTIQNCSQSYKTFTSEIYESSANFLPVFKN